MALVTATGRLMILASGLTAAGCGELPRDPEGTLRRVEGGRLRVGLVESPPWVVRTAGEPAGVEVELVRQFAAELGVTPEWRWGGEQQHMEALERFELDLAAGGLADDTPWEKRIGLTGPYFEDRVVAGDRWRTRKHVLAIPPGENGWLRRLEEYLYRRRADVGGLLDREVTRP